MLPHQLHQSDKKTKQYPNRTNADKKQRLMTSNFSIIFHLPNNKRRTTQNQNTAQRTREVDYTPQVIINNLTDKRV